MIPDQLKDKTTKTNKKPVKWNHSREMHAQNLYRWGMLEAVTIILPYWFMMWNDDENRECIYPDLNMISK